MKKYGKVSKNSLENNSNQDTKIEVQQTFVAARTRSAVNRPATFISK